MRNWIAHIILSLIIGLFVVGQSRREQQVPVPANNLIAKTNEARTMLDQAKAAALKISSDFKRQLVLDEIGAAQAKAGELDDAVDTANKAFPFADATLDAIGEQLAATNDLTRAKSLGLKLKEGGASTVISCMTRSQAKKRDIDQALRTAKQIRFLEVRSYALEEIAQQQAARGDYSGARRTFALARAAHRKGLITADDIEMMIALSQLSRGDTQAARKTIDSWKSGERRYSAMIGLAEGFLQKGDKPSAAAWVQDALKGLPAGSNYDFWRYLVIPLQVKLGQNERAMQAANALSPDMRVKGYNGVAVVCAEAKDVACVNDAVEKMQSVSSKGENRLSGFGMKLTILNVTAALIDNGQFDAASGLLTTVEQDLDDVGKMAIEPNAQLQRVFVLALQGEFDDARSLALKIRVGSVDEVERGTALRITAPLQTRKNGVASTQPWASAPADTEDRAYALLGIAQALLEIDNVKLHYSAIQIH